ncbi:MAG TPA: MBL fold metallo-hydrolase [Verrucomicrobiae bacterium]|jgi:L-ascorbate metabolism protein UlaG (beta-lactamase superfamily)|nr:MBL fold metallo-hydrolase [Verrucomicrobiae bacterium]
MQLDSKVNRSGLVATYIGGPTALFKWDGLRLLTDPTFDPAGTNYVLNLYTLKKREGPAIPPEKLGHIDAVLLSHDHHFDNLDRAGRALLTSADKVLTTEIGAQRLGGKAIGLTRWQSVEIPGRDGRKLRITATPARHGPVGGDRGPVVGFVLNFTDAPDDCLYISGDTVWFDDLEEVARRFTVTTAVLFMGAAIVPRVGPAHLTMTAEERRVRREGFPQCQDCAAALFGLGAFYGITRRCSKRVYQSVPADPLVLAGAGSGKDVSVSAHRTAAGA